MKSQVLCSVVDNAANMAKTIKLLNSQGDDDEDVDDKADDDDPDNDEDVEDEADDVDDPDMNIEEPEGEAAGIMIVDGREMEHMRCAAHTYQLGKHTFLSLNSTHMGQPKSGSIKSVDKSCLLGIFLRWLQGVSSLIWGFLPSLTY